MPSTPLWRRILTGKSPIYTRIRLLEWALASFMFAWAFKFVLDPSQLVSDEYAYMGTVLRPAQWVGLCMSVVLVRAIFLVLNGNLGIGAIFRGLSAMFGLAWWPTVAGMQAVALGKIPPSVGWFAVLTFWELVCLCIAFSQSGSVLGAMLRHHWRVAEVHRRVEGVG